jgi:hypothetical protein
MRAKIGSLESHLPSGFISEIKTASIRKYIAAKIIATGFNALATRLFRVGGCKLGAVAPNPREIFVIGCASHPRRSETRGVPYRFHRLKMSSHI